MIKCLDTLVLNLINYHFSIGVNSVRISKNSYNALSKRGLIELKKLCKITGIKLMVYNSN
jgi:hypothetical protein